MIRPELRWYAQPEAPRARVVILPHAGGSASFFRDWAPVAGALSLELAAVQYPGHEELFTRPRASSLDELAEGVVRLVEDQSERTVLLGHSMGGLLAHKVARLLTEGRRPLLGLHISATRAPDQAVMRPRHLLSDTDLVASIGAMTPGEENPLEDAEVAAVLLGQVRLEMRLAETHTCAPAPLPLPIVLHLGSEDPDFTLPDASAWERFTACGTRLVLHQGHHFYLVRRKSDVLQSIIDNLPTSHLDTHQPKGDSQCFST